MLLYVVLWSIYMSLCIKLYQIQKVMEELEYIITLLKRYVVFQFFYKLVADIIFLMKAESYHITHDDYYFNYYMKTYFKYFNLNYPTTSTQ